MTFQHSTDKDSPAISTHVEMYLSITSVWLVASCRQSIPVLHHKISDFQLFFNLTLFREWLSCRHWRSLENNILLQKAAIKILKDFFFTKLIKFVTTSQNWKGVWKKQKGHIFDDCNGLAVNDSQYYEDICIQTSVFYKLDIYNKSWCVPL